MAVQGKLVPQDPNDEPASVLLERIRKEKEQLIKEGKIKKEKNPSYIFRGADNTPYEKIGNAEPVSIADEVPFEIPESWEWVRVKTIANVLGGKRIPAGRKLSSEDTGHIYIRVSDMKNHGINTSGLLYVPDDIFPLISRYIIRKEDLYITVAGTIGHVGKVPPELDGANLTENADRLVFRNVNQDWLLYCLSSPLVQNQIVDATTKVGQPKLAIIRIESILVPLPPLEEQQRIVNRVREIEPFAEKYEVAEDKLATLNAVFPDQLKKSILQLAVQGKLVPQDPNDVPASVLLEKIRAEKELLIREGKIKRDKNESVIFRRDNSHYEKQGNTECCIDDEIPFDIPDSWEWIRWGSLSESIQYGFNAPAQDSGRIRMVRISDIQNNSVQWDTVPYCDIAETDIETYLLKKNDILFARTGGTVGKSFLVDEIPEESVYAGYLIRTRYSSLLSPQYLKFFMESPFYWSQLKEGTTATAQPNCNGKTLGNMFVPIPPASEQLRIVKAVNSAFSAISAL
jgi:type I restriction enzyme S subunit